MYRLSPVSYPLLLVLAVATIRPAAISAGSEGAGVPRLNENANGADPFRPPLHSVYRR